MDKGKVAQVNEASSWVYNEDNGWINIINFLKKINLLSNKIRIKLEKDNIRNNGSVNNSV